MPQSDATEETNKNAMRTLREKKSLTQAEAARKVKISRSLWSALELKQRPLTVTLLNQIEVALNLKEDEVNYLRTWWGNGEAETDSKSNAA